MRRFLTYLFLTTIQINAFGQNNMTYNGGLEKFYETIGKNIRYPPNDRNEGIEGVVILKFKTNGNIIDSLEVLNSVSTKIDMEAIRVFKLTSGQWRLTPNKFYLVTIIFRLDFPGRKTTESIKYKRDRSIKRENFNEALNYAEEIKRREPLDFKNLEILRDTYDKILQSQKRDKIVDFKNKLETIPFIGKT